MYQKIIVIYVYMYTCILVYIYMYVYMYIRTYVHMYMCKNININIYIYSMYKCIYVYVYVNMYFYIYIYIYHYISMYVCIRHEKKRKESHGGQPNPPWSRVRPVTPTEEMRMNVTSWEISDIWRNEGGTKRWWFWWDMVHQNGEIMHEMSGFMIWDMWNIVEFCDDMSVYVCLCYFIWP